MTAGILKHVANHEIVTLAVYLLGAEARKIDTEDIANKADEPAPGRFTWRKFVDQINIDTVRKRLWDATRADKGGLLMGTEKDGWILTDAGWVFAKDLAGRFQELDFSRQATNSKERIWIRRERFDLALPATASETVSRFPTSFPLSQNVADRKSTS